jgi:hypothetical protein
MRALLHKPEQLFNYIYVVLLQDAVRLSSLLHAVVPIVVSSPPSSCYILTLATGPSLLFETQAYSPPIPREEGTLQATNHTTVGHKI